MKRVTAMLRGAAVAGLLLTACGGQTPCEEMCNRVRPKLIANFGVLPEKIECSDQKWEGTCEYCLQLLVTDYQVQSTDTCP